jgi:hypothetical protein
MAGDKGMIHTIKRVVKVRIKGGSIAAEINRKKAGLMNHSPQKEH